MTKKEWLDLIHDLGINMNILYERLDEDAQEELYMDGTYEQIGEALFDLRRHFEDMEE